jgi:RNA polymerase sigma-70 factor (ECF subfamily)
LDFNDDQWKSWAFLMGQIQEGDMEAYALLLSEISPLIFNYVRKRVFNSSQVEDVYQDVLLTFHKARHTYQTNRPFSPWLFTVVRNAVWAALSKRHKVTQKEIQLETLPETSAQVHKEEGLEDDLQDALNALPEANRRAVEMLKLQGMDLETAARELGISKVALKVRAHRGYAQLRKKLMREN